VNRPLWLAQDVLRMMLAACERAYPAEACGMLGGAAFVATSHYAVANVAAQPAERFEMDPEGQRRALETMAERGERLLAIYHSHPSTAPVPSRADRAGAQGADVYHLIVGLAKSVPEIRAFRIHPLVRQPVEVRWYPVGAWAATARWRAAAPGRDFHPF